MGTSSGTETVTQNSEPWSQAQPYLSNIFGQAQNLYNQGAEYYPGSTVVPFSPLTQQGMDGLQQQFSSGAPVGYQTAENSINRVANSNTANNPFITNVQNAGGVKNDAGANVLQSFANNGQSNPFLDQTFNNAAEQVRDNTSAIFSKSGRYGSVAHQDALSDSLGDMATQLYGNAYETDQNRRFGAAEALGARQAGDINRNLSAQSTAAGLNQGANSQAMQAASLYPTLNSYGQSNNRGLMELGNMYEGQAARELQDSMDRHNFGQNAGWDLLSRYNQTVQPIAGMGGSSTSTAPAQSQWGGALQSGLGLGVAASAIPGIGWGAAGIGALGGLAGLL